jgi:hypothetical protein
LRRRNDFSSTVCISAWNQIRNTAVGPVMFTVEQCLAKAVELEQRMGEGLPPDVRDDYGQLALQWRRLAERARIQDRRMTGTG